MKNKLLKILSVITIIPFFIKLFKERKRKSKLRRKIISDGGDYTDSVKNIANSIAKSKLLYRELIVKVHPDKFLDDKKHVANELASRITKSKRNYNDLMNLKVEIDEFIANN
jgi:hypothetical protein